MNKDFKLALLSFLFWDRCFEPYIIQDIPNWPNIQVTDYEGDTFMETLDTENIEFISYTDNTLLLVCGGSWQKPHQVTIGLIDGQARVLNIEMVDVFQEGIKYSDFISLFVDVIGETPKPKRTLVELNVALNTAIENENYELAAQIRDEIIELEK